MGANTNVRRWRLVLVAGGLGIVGAVILVVFAFQSQLWEFRRIEASTTPTPHDLAGSVRLFQRFVMYAVLSGGVGCSLVLLAWLRIRDFAAREERARIEREDWR